MTGRYPFRFGDPKWGTFPYQTENQTIAHAFKNAGYKTAVAGKWQMTMLSAEPDHPYRLGFDEYCLFGWHEGPRYHQPLIWQNGEIRDDVSDKYGPDVYSDFLIDFMKRNAKDPFLAYYPMALIHDVSNDLEEHPPFGPEGRYENVSEMVSEMDRIVGKMMDAVRGLGLENRTLVIYTSDNGTNHKSIIGFEDEEFVKETVYSRMGGLEVAGGKRELNDRGVRVPLIASWPGKIKPGTSTGAMTDFSDFLPTLVEIAGLGPPDYYIDGRSFAKVLYGKETESRTWVFSQSGPEKHMIRNKRWKLLWDGKLFDMKSDPMENHPIPVGHSQKGTADARMELDSTHEALRKAPASTRR